MVEDRVEIGDGGVVTVQEHPQRMSVVVVMPSGDAVEMSPEEARKVVTAMIRACIAIESSPDYEPCAFSDVPDHSTGHTVTGIEAVEERLARLEAFVARWACIVGAPGTEFTRTAEALVASGFDPRGGA